MAPAQQDWRAAGIGVVGFQLIGNNSTKERRGFQERKRLEGFGCRVSCRRCVGLRALTSSFKHEALRLVSDRVMAGRMGKEEGVLRRQPVITCSDSWRQIDVFCVNAAAPQWGRILCPSKCKCEVRGSQSFEGSSQPTPASRLMSATRDETFFLSMFFFNQLTSQLKRRRL